MEATRKTHSAASRQPGDAPAPFLPIIEAFAGDNRVSRGKMFGATGLKVNDKVFAMLVKQRFVAKLPKARVDELVAAGIAEHFDPGHGKLMKEWARLGGSQDRWLELAREARDFVAGGSA